MNRRHLLAPLLALLLPGMVLAQVYVVPRRALRGPVRTYDFAWQHLDILVGPEAEGVAAPPAHRAHTEPPGAPGGPTPAAPTQPQMRAPGVSTRDTREVPANKDSHEAVVALESTDGGMPYVGGSGNPLESIEPGNPTPVVEKPAQKTDGGTPDEQIATGSSLYIPSVALADGGTPDAGPGYATSLGAKSGGVRFYFYESERNVAQYAAPQLEDAYRYLVDRFKFVPTQTFPYILYSSYQEFLQTNVTAVSEGTLGVTSTQGHLELTLPYLGDHRLFSEISTHELSHQFTIQKVRFLAEQAKVSGDPLNGMPLWFIEGLAEFYAKGGLDPEGEMLVRDLLINPDLQRGYAFLDFWSPGPYGYLWIYKVGQARCQFLEETYGAGFIQKVLENSPKLVSGTAMAPNLQFEGLMEMLTGDDPPKIAAKFEAWLKQRAYTTYLKAEQSTPAMDLLREREGIVTALNSSSDGRVLIYRSIVPETGESKLILVDPRAPKSSVKVQGDGVPGYESLHSVFGRNFALTNDKLAFVAETLSRDVIYVQSYKHTAEPIPMNNLPGGHRNPYLSGSSELHKEPPYKVDFSLGERVAYRLADHGLIAAASLAFSPDGKQLAFIGLSEAGTRDVYVLPLDQGTDVEPQQVTHDVFAERSLAWGPAGIVYTSDATAHGYYNLFRVKPENPTQVERLTTEARDDADPTVMPDGRLYFVAYEKSRSDLHEYTGGGSIVRRTDVATGLYEPCPGPDGNLWTLYHLSGERKPALLRSQQLKTLQVTAPMPSDVGPPGPLPQRSLLGSEAYKPFAKENIDLGPILGFAGGGGGGFIGQVFASAADRLRNHAVMFQLAVYGSFDLTDGYLLYLNQSQRTTWGGGLFQSLRFRVDQDLRKAAGGQLPYYILISGERFYGVTGLARYPLTTFTFLEANLSLGGTSYFLDPTTSFYLNLKEINGIGDLYTPWLQNRPSARFQTEGSVSYGYNTLRYHYTGTPIDGTSFLAALTTGVQPFNGEVFGNLRLDAEHYFPIPLGSTHILLRGGAGTTYGGRFSRSFYLSSFDTLRGVNFGDERWLLGQHYGYSTLELRVPLDALIHIAFLNSLMGVAGMDFGGVGGSARDVWDHRVLDAAVGINVGLGPLLLRLHFAYPFDIKAAAGRPSEKWVTQFSIGIAGLEGYLFKNQGAPPGAKPMPAPPMNLGGAWVGGR